MAKAKEQKFAFTLKDEIRIIYASAKAETEEQALRKVRDAYPRSDSGQASVGAVHFSFNYEPVKNGKWKCLGTEVE